MLHYHAQRLDDRLHFVHRDLVLLCQPPQQVDSVSVLLDGISRGVDHLPIMLDSTYRLINGVPILFDELFDFGD